MADTSAEFYRVLADIYDDLFPVEDNTLALLLELAEPREAPVLDLACGSGLYTFALAERGINAFGTDLSPDLVERAQSRGAHEDRFAVADMRTLGRQESIPLPGSYNLIFCIGNSIAHLASMDEVGEVIDHVARALPAVGAHAVIQFVEMDEIAVGCSRELPALTASGGSGEVYRFERFYHRISDMYVRFDATLTGDAGRPQTVSNTLLVMKSDMVRDRFRRHGFSCGLSGGFSGEPVDGSWVRVLVARRETV